MQKGLLLIAVFLAGCNSSEAPETDRESTALRSQEYLTASTLFVQQSAEYRALCYQAFAAAEFQLVELLKQKPVNPAVVLDLDETVLDNSAYTAWQVVNDQPYSTETWALWTDLAKAPEVPGVGDFLRLADTLGVTLFYISNRDTSALNPTIENMRNLNLPQLIPSQFYLKTTTSDKAERRQAVEDAGHEVVMLIGDNLGDFHEKWDKKSVKERKSLTENDRDQFGKKYIVLPNPIYGTWEGALFDYNRNFNEAQKDSIRRSWLDPAILE